MSTIRILTAVVLSLAVPGCTTGCATDTAEPIDLPLEESLMAALTITAVDTGANTLTITGHGLNTGDGPAAVRNIGGALPGGLAAVTDYFVIRVDANTLKLAVSSTDAMAGTAIDITSAGSGTNILEIGVPYRRPRTYAPGVLLKSDDLNANFDAWKALHALLTGQSQSVWDGATLAGALAVSGALTANGDLGIANATTMSGVITPTALSAGATTEDFTATGIGSASIVRLSTSGGACSLGGISASVNANRILLLVNLGANNISLIDESAGSSVQFRFSLPGAASVVIRPNGSVMIWYDTTSLRWRAFAI